jgi:translation initiation factor IF-3
MSNKVHELRFTARIADHDLGIKMKQASKWLQNKEQVKVSVQLKGREQGRPDLAFELLEKIVKLLEEHGSPANAPSKGRYQITFNPKSSK